jgi:hypothetical protein
MKFRNNWKVTNKQFDKFKIRIRLSFVDFLWIELDFSKKFYMFTLLNFAIKNK